MLNIEAFEKIIENKEEGKLNSTLLWAYRDSKENGNELIDFADTICGKDVSPIAKSLKENRIRQFTISSRLSGLATILGLFQNEGVKMNRIVMVNAGYKDYISGQQAILPAILMEVEL